MSKLAALKKLATCLGCCQDTKDNPAKSNDEAIDFICKNFECKGKTCKGLSGITLKVDADGKLERGIWTDSAGERHLITINH